jgi:hypothetical protein
VNGVRGANGVRKMVIGRVAKVHVNARRVAHEPPRNATRLPLGAAVVNMRRELALVALEKLLLYPNKGVAAQVAVSLANEAPGGRKRFALAGAHVPRLELNADR